MHAAPRKFCIYNRDITTEDIENVNRRTNAIIIHQCTSDDWHAVVKRIAELKSVTELTMTNCGLDDLQIHPLYAMSHLKKLVLDGNELRSGCGYWTTGTLELEELSLVSNPLNDAVEDMEVFEVLRTLPKLKTMKVPMLNLKSLGMGLIEELTDEVLEIVLSNTPNLESLEITSPKLTKVGVRHIIERLKPTLKHLAFGKCVASLQCLQDIAQLPKLTELNLLDCKVKDTHLEIIAKLQNLTYLGLESNEITDVGVNTITSSLDKLKELNLGKNQFTHVGMVTIARLKYLTRLSTIECRGNELSLYRIVTDLTDLEELWINMSLLTDNIVRQISTRLRKLKKLFASQSGATSGQAMMLVRGLPNLDSLVMRTISRNLGTNPLLRWSTTRNMKFCIPSKCYLLVEDT